ncbi:hypothetical protein K491DRAFT_225710 [Lophiostoma macrostomum CBS 122681]|uniref:Uncharacterized protein n=1 Tax=Lophiostoma macrostomum CBS 122681 TaxID=1314788 RepID=A0A6A6TJB8_9PLEO|nr:hypothetical protein K491DRAFT_225710 [Lophiostoma macrostomum CBS 122681]
MPLATANSAIRTMDDVGFGKDHHTSDARTSVESDQHLYTATVHVAVTKPSKDNLYRNHCGLGWTYSLLVHAIGTKGHVRHHIRPYELPKYEARSALSGKGGRINRFGKSSTWSQPCLLVSRFLRGARHRRHLKIPVAHGNAKRIESAAPRPGWNQLRRRPFKNGYASRRHHSKS